MAAVRMLVAFHTSEGQTAKIAEHIGDILELEGADVDVVEASQAPAPDGYDGVVLGDSIHGGQHSRALIDYLRQHATSLAARPTALFQVSLTSVERDPEHLAQAEALVRALEEETGFEPDHVGMFAGALAYTKYGWLKRRILQSIADKEGGATDTSVDHEYTDWAEVEHFARRAYQLVSSRTNGAEPRRSTP